MSDFLYINVYSHVFGRAVKTCFLTTSQLKPNCIKLDCGFWSGNDFRQSIVLCVRAADVLTVQHDNRTATAVTLCHRPQVNHLRRIVWGSFDCKLQM